MDGLISLSSYSSWPDVFWTTWQAWGAEGSRMGGEAPCCRLCLGEVWRRARKDHPIDQIANLGDRPALIIHSRRLQVPYASFERLMQKHGPC